MEGREHLSVPVGSLLTHHRHPMSRPTVLAVRGQRRRNTTAGSGGTATIEVEGETVRGPGAGEQRGSFLLHAVAVALARLEGEGGALPDVS